VIELRGRGGSVEIIEDGHIYIARPKGYISRSLLRRGLEHTRAFADAHPDGWWHVTDGVHFVVPSPLNPFLLRRIRRLPHIRGYVLVQPSWILRFVSKVFWRHLIGADVVVAKEGGARKLIASRSVRTRAATVDDALDMSRIHFAAENAALDEWGAGVHMDGDVEDAAHGWRQPLRDGEHRYVAEVAGSVVAWLLVNVVTHELEGLYVDPAHQRKGIGAVLMRQADTLLSAAGPSAELWVMSGHKSARAFYEAHGWEPDLSHTRNITMEGVDLPQVLYVKHFG